MALSVPATCHNVKQSFHILYLLLNPSIPNIIPTNPPFPYQPRADTPEEPHNMTLLAIHQTPQPLPINLTHRSTPHNKSIIHHLPQSENQFIKILQHNRKSKISYTELTRNHSTSSPHSIQPTASAILQSAGAWMKSKITIKHLHSNNVLSKVLEQEYHFVLYPKGSLDQ